MRMKRRGHISDGRVSRQEGDIVKISKPARDGVKRETGITISQSAIGIVRKLAWDTNWYAIVEISGQQFYFSLGDLISV